MCEQTHVEDLQAADANKGQGKKKKSNQKNIPICLDNRLSVQAETLTYDLTDEPLVLTPRASSPSADREGFVEAVTLEYNTNDHHK